MIEFDNQEIYDRRKDHLHINQFSHSLLILDSYMPTNLFLFNSMKAL